MSNIKQFKTTEIEEIKSFIRDGLTYAEVGELMGRSKKSIENLVTRMGWSNGRLGGNQRGRGHRSASEVSALEKPEPPVEQKQEVQVKEKTLKDFSAREMIKYLYNLGYRIEDNRLVCYVKQAVNVKDIINA